MIDYGQIIHNLDELSDVATEAPYTVVMDQFCDAWPVWKACEYDNDGQRIGWDHTLVWFLPLIVICTQTDAGDYRRKIIGAGK